MVMVMVMVIFSALVRSHQSTSPVASASCVPRGYNTRAQPCLKMWRGSPDLPARRPLRRPARARRTRRGSRCCIIWEATAGFGVGGGGGLSTRARCPRYPCAPSSCHSHPPHMPFTRLPHIPGRLPSSHPFTSRRPLAIAIHPPASLTTGIWWNGSSRYWVAQPYGAGAVDTGGFLADHLLVAHFVAGPRSQELRCSRAHCAWRSVLRFSISVPCLSQSHRTSPLTSISARRRRRRGPDLQKLSWSTASKGARVCW